jgi:hypothetical protein
MRPSESQIESEKKVRLQPLHRAVTADGADLGSDEIAELVKTAVAYRPTTLADICRYTGLPEHDVRRLWGKLIDQRS